MRVEGLQITKFVCIRGIIGGLWPRDPADSVIPTQILAGYARIFIGVWRRQVFFLTRELPHNPNRFLLDVVVVLCAQLCGAGWSICEFTTA